MKWHLITLPFSLRCLCKFQFSAIHCPFPAHSLIRHVHSKKKEKKSQRLLICMRSVLVQAVSLELKWKWEMEKEEITEMHVVPPSRPASWAVDTGRKRKKRGKMESDSGWVSNVCRKENCGKEMQKNRNARKTVQETKRRFKQSDDLKLNETFNLLFII